MSNASELERLDGWIGGLMLSVGPSQRAVIARQIASIMRGTNAKRIAAQRNPDGSAFEARRTVRKRKPSTKARKFLYPSGGSGAPRTVLLKSWLRKGPLITGYDVEAGGIRSFEEAKVIKWLKPSPEEQSKPSPSLRQRSTIKSRIMFRKLRTYSLLKSGATATEAWTGFSGRAGAIARVHQEGGVERSTPKSPLIRYPKRALLGLTPSDERQILDAIMAAITPR